MKRILCLAVVLLCLPVLAQADSIETYDLDSYSPNENGNIFIDPVSDRAMITGNLNGAIVLTVNHDMELIFRNVNINHDASLDGGGGGALHLMGPGDLTITFEGSNILTSTNVGIYNHCTGSLTLQGNGDWLFSSSDNDTIHNPGYSSIQFTLPEYGGQVPQDKRFKTWRIRLGAYDTGTEKNIGETISCTDVNIYIDPVFEDAAVPVVPTAGGSSNVPKTGDEANLLLWSALAGISAIGMAALAYKRKEA